MKYIYTYMTDLDFYESIAKWHEKRRPSFCYCKITIKDQRNKMAKKVD